MGEKHTGVNVGDNQGREHIVRHPLHRLKGYNHGLECRFGQCCLDIDLRITAPSAAMSKTESLRDEWTYRCLTIKAFIRYFSRLTAPNGTCFLLRWLVTASLKATSDRNG